MMHASAGDKILTHGSVVGAPERHGTILEARGADGGPPYLVRYDDGHESIVFPGADSEIHHEVLPSDSP
jgi:hypothetical protein